MDLDHASVTVNRRDNRTGVAYTGPLSVQPELGRRDSPPEHRPLPGNNTYLVGDSRLAGCGNRETAHQGLSAYLLTRSGSAETDSVVDAAVGMAS
jgi:hypothetical protein